MTEPTDKSSSEQLTREIEDRVAPLVEPNSCDGDREAPQTERESDRDSDSSYPEIFTTPLDLELEIEQNPSGSLDSTQ